MEGDTLTLFDIGIISIIAISTLFAVLRGFIRSSLSLAGWVGAGILALYAEPYITPHIAQQLDWNEGIIKSISIGIGYIVALIIFAIINSMIASVLAPITRGTIDRSLGVAFGLARGVLFSCLIFVTILLGYNMLKGVAEGEGQEKDKNILYGLTHDAKVSGPDFIQHSRTYTLLKHSSRFLLDSLPVGAMKHTEDMMETAQDSALMFAGEDGEGKDENASDNSDSLPLEMEILKNLPIGRAASLLQNEDVQKIIGETVKKDWKNVIKNGSDSSEETGYSAGQIKQFKRLIEQSQ